MATGRLARRVILSLALSGAALADPPTTALIGTPPQPNWKQLPAQQQTILAPLAGSWDAMESIRRKKWLGIAERYPAMKPEEQQRMQERMREWATLTPEERAKARVTYKDFRQLPAEQKQIVKQKWEAYSVLPSQEKQRLREQGKSSRLLGQAATPSPDSQNPASSTEKISLPANSPQ